MTGIKNGLRRTGVGCQLTYCGIFFATVLAIGSSACSALLDFDPEGLPCDPSGNCDTGYSCRESACIAHESLVRGEPCEADAQCAGDLHCPQRGRFCTANCNTPFGDGENCMVGEYCAPSYTDAGFVGFCKSGDLCSPIGPERPAQAPCDLGSHCVPLTEDAFACLVGCEVDFTGTAHDVYADNCGDTTESPLYCQPLGRSQGEQELLCLEAATPQVAQGVDQVCDLTQSRCADGHACIDGTCKRYCNPNAPLGACPDGQRCCTQQPTTSGSDYAFCSDNCN